MKKVLLAGATGYLGRYIASELFGRKYPNRIILRRKDQIRYFDITQEIFKGEITKPETLNLNNSAMETDLPQAHSSQNSTRNTALVAVLIAAVAERQKKRLKL